MTDDNEQLPNKRFLEKARVHNDNDADNDDNNDTDADNDDDEEDDEEENDDNDDDMAVEEGKVLPQNQLQAARPLHISYNTVHLIALDCIAVASTHIIQRSTL